jgi:hypothetical protein
LTQGLHLAVDALAGAAGIGGGAAAKHQKREREQDRTHAVLPRLTCVHSRLLHDISTRQKPVAFQARFAFA